MAPRRQGPGKFLVGGKLGEGVCALYTGGGKLAGKTFDTVGAFGNTVGGAVVGTVGVLGNAVASLPGAGMTPLRLLSKKEAEVCNIVQCDLQCSQQKRNKALTHTCSGIMGTCIVGIRYQSPLRMLFQRQRHRCAISLNSIYGVKMNSVE